MIGSEKVIAGLVVFSGLLVTAPRAAELTVIFDNGQARPMSVFLGPVQSMQSESDPEEAGHRPGAAERLGAADLESLLPIRSPGLTRGRVRSRAHKVPFARAFFLIGSDEWSMQWLRKHRKKLKEMGAVGLLVEVRTVEDLRAIARIAQGLPITPASGTDIAKALGIAHYPVGLSGTRIWQ